MRTPPASPPPNASRNTQLKGPVRAEKPPRLFLRLPQDHPARRASPYASLETLRAHLDETSAAALKEVRQVPSGLAIQPKDGIGAQLLIERKDLLERVI